MKHVPSGGWGCDNCLHPPQKLYNTKYNLYICSMKTKEFKDVFFIAVFVVFCFLMGVIFESKRPEYKAHVKGEVVNVVEIK